MRGIKTILLLGAASLFSGCATMSKEQCLQADWHRIGFHDGAAGRFADRLASHREACAEVNIIPDATAYQSGRNEGLKQYCTAENGLHLGLSGKASANVCPTPLASAFLPRYRLGAQIHHQREAIKVLKRSLADEQLSLAQKTEAADIRDEQREISKLKNQLAYSTKSLAEIEICIATDARQSGLAFGSHGYPYSPALISNCLQYGVKLNASQFLAGWQQGNSQYCSYDSGRYAGQHNLEYLGTCQGTMHHHFWSGYQAGLELARSEWKLRELERENRAKQQQLEQNRREAEAARARERALEQQLLAATRRNESNGHAHEQHNGPRYPVTPVAAPIVAPVVAQTVSEPQRTEHEKRERNKHRGSEVNEDIDDDEKRLADIEHEIRAKKQTLKRRNISDKERQAIRKRLAELSHEQQQMAKRLQRQKHH